LPGARICEVNVGGVLKELCMLCWGMRPINELAASLRHLMHTVRKRDDGLMVTLDDRRDHSDGVEELRAGHVHLV